MDELEIKTLIQIIKNSNDIVFLTGAGVSTPSHIPDFRSPASVNKVEETYHLPVEVILSHDYFYEHPDIFYDYYFRFMVHEAAKPNIIHQFIAKLTNQTYKNVTVVTQNIDGLHELACDKNVLTLHGTIFSNHCTHCFKSFDLKEVLKLKPIPHCPICQNIIKPDVVLYGEMLDQWTLDQSLKAILKADTLIVLGTSLRVYPASGLIRYFKGKNLVIINKEKTPYDEVATHVYHTSLESVFTKLDEYFF